MAANADSRYLALEVPEDQLLAYLAQEGGLTDVALDALVAQLDDPELDPGELAAVALTVGRAGRASSRPALMRLERRLERAGAVDEALAVRLAASVLHLRPPPAVERGDEGYRMQTEQGELFVEDPVAAHWHRAGRWGPPLRPDLERAPLLARGSGRADEWYQAAADGRIVVVTFRPARFGAHVEPALRLTRAGMARTAQMQDMVRWSELESLGKLSRGRRERVGFAARGQTPRGLPDRPSIPVSELLGLMERLLKQARS